MLLEHLRVLVTTLMLLVEVLLLREHLLLPSHRSPVLRRRRLLPLVRHLVVLLLDDVASPLEVHGV